MRCPLLAGCETRCRIEWDRACMVLCFESWCIPSNTGGDRLDLMKQFSPTIWATIGWISLGLSAWSFVLATVDGVMAYFVVVIAIIIGGFSSIGVTASARFAVSTVVLGTVLIFWMTHHVASTGFQLPDGNSMATMSSSISIPILVFVAMMIWGIHRRKTFPRPSSE